MRPSECVVLHFILFQRNGFWEMPFLWLTLTDTRWRYGAFCYAFWFLWFLLATLCPLREFGSMLKRTIN